MDIFLKETNYQKLTQKKNSLVIFILSIKKQNCSQNFSTKKTPDPDRFANLCYQTLKREIITVLHKFLQKTEEEGTFPDCIQPALPCCKNQKKMLHENVTID